MKDRIFPDWCGSRMMARVPGGRPTSAVSWGMFHRQLRCLRTLSWFKRIGFVTRFRATFGLTRSIGGWEEGERRERNKRKRQPGRTGAGQRGDWQLNQARSSIGFHVARKPPWKFQPAFFFFFFFCCAGSWRRWPPTLQEDLWLSMFYVVFATVRARASGNEQRVRQTGRYRNSFHTMVLGRSGPLNMLNRRQKWLPRAHSNRALNFWCTLQPLKVRVWRLFFYVSHPFFLKINATARKKNTKK